MFNSSNGLSIIFIKNWFIIDSNETESINSNVVRLEFLNCSIDELDSTILNENVMKNLQSLTISNQLSNISVDAFDKLINLNDLTLKLDNLGKFIESQRNWIPKKSTITIKFIDYNNVYEFPSDDYCFFKNLNDYGINIVFETKNYPNNSNITCTLHFLYHNDKLNIPFNVSNSSTDQCNCESNTSTTAIENEINPTKTTISKFTTSNETNFNTTITIFLNTTVISNSETKKPIILFFSLIGVSISLLISLLITIIVCCKYRKLRSFKSDVAYELNEGNYVDKFE